MNKKINFSSIIIIIILGLIAYVAWLYIDDISNDNISCSIKLDTKLDNDAILKVQASGKNAIIKKSDGTNTNQSYYEEKIYQNGTYTFYVTNGKKENSCSITINEMAEKPTGKITINTTKLTTKVTLTLVPDDKNNLDSKPYSWNKKNWTNKNTLSVTKNGTYTGYIKDKNGNIGKITYEVTNIGTVAANSVSLDKTDITISVDGTTTLKATILPSNASNKKLTWTSDNTKIATVNSNGKITGKSAGTTTITAKTANGKVAICNVTVKKNQKYAEIYFLNVYNRPNILASLANDENYKTGYSNGESFIIKTLDNKYILIDTGIKNDEVAKVIYDGLKDLQNKNKVTIDYMILTHAHTDHTGNALTLLGNNNIVTNKVIMKKESKASSIYTKVSNQLNNPNKLMSPTKEGQKISVGKYLELYIFNVSDVYANKTCHTAGNLISFTASTKYATKLNGKYYYFDGGNYPNIKLIATDTLTTKYSTIKKGIDNYYYLFQRDIKRNDCNSNANSYAIIVKVKTDSGNRYMYLPGDLDNSGYDITPINDIFGNGLQIIYPDMKQVKVVNSKNGLFSGYTADINRVASETNAAKNIKKLLGNDIKNITIYQAAHHGINNAPDAINLLGINKSSVYTIIPIKSVGAGTANFSLSRTYNYTLSNTKKFYPGGKTKNGIYCSINDIGKTLCNEY